MGSETESKDLEVKKAHTRTRSKQKQEKNEELISHSPNLNNDIMAKISNGTISAKKGKGKKSQKMVANSLDETNDNAESQDFEETRKTRQGKRITGKKSVSSEIIAKDSTPKRIRKECAVTDDKNDENDDEEANENSKKPKKPSKRQQKRERAEQRESLKREAGRLEATDRALNYVSKWKHARSEWKFEKIRQIWLMDNLLDDNLIPDEIFPTVLEYFEGCKGMAREQLLKKGMDVIRKQEEKEETTNEDEEESVEYKRARQLLQALPTET